MSDKTLGEKILQLIPDSLQEDLIKEVKAILIEKGEVTEVVMERELTKEEKTEMTKTFLID